MKVIVLGSGLIGLTTAYYLARLNHEVAVIDREGGPGRETSFANGALLTPSMADPWNTPGSWKVLLASLCKSDSALQVRWRTLPSLTGWGLRFLVNSTAAAWERNKGHNLRLALYSLSTLRVLREETSIEYGRVARGSLRLFRSRASLERAVVSANKLAAEGLQYRSLTTAQTIELEPALEPLASALTGAIHYDADEIGDAYQFCLRLADIARGQGVQFQFHNNATALELRGGEIAGVITDQGRLLADRYVVAAGSYSTPILNGIGLSLPVQPAKGYSVTFEDSKNVPSLRSALIDDDEHAAVVPLEGAIRVAGTAEFSGYDRTLSISRIRNLHRLVGRLLPQARLDVTTAKAWCGLRAMSPDGVPIIGPTRIPNLLINTGHGHLGWTMAAGSGQLLADLMSERSPPIDPAPYALARFHDAPNYPLAALSPPDTRM